MKTNAQNGAADLILINQEHRQVSAATLTFQRRQGRVLGGWRTCYTANNRIPTDNIKVLAPGSRPAPQRLGHFKRPQPIYSYSFLVFL